MSIELRVQRTEKPPAGAVCALHPGAPAVVTCERCGNYACRECVDDLYAAIVTCRGCSALIRKGRYYAEPPVKVVFLYIATFGLYGLVWSYRQWRGIKRKDKTTIWPIARAVFFNLTLYLLIHDLNDRARQSNEAGTFFPELNTGVALLFFVLGAVARWLPQPYSLGSLLAGICLYPVATRIAELEGSEATLAHRRLSMLEWALVALGLLLFAHRFGMLPG